MEDVNVREAIAHFEYGIKCDMFKEPVTSYARLAVEALKGHLCVRSGEVSFIDEVKQTNYDRIKKMSVEEMAEFMREMLDCVSCQSKMMNNRNPLGKEKCNDVDYFKMCEGDYKKCLATCKQWLLQEVTDDE